MKTLANYIDEGWEFSIETQKPKTDLDNHYVGFKARNMLTYQTTHYHPDCKSNWMESEGRVMFTLVAEFRHFRTYTRKWRYWYDTIPTIPGIAVIMVGYDPNELLAQMLDYLEGFIPNREIELESDNG